MSDELKAAAKAYADRWPDGSPGWANSYQSFRAGAAFRDDAVKRLVSACRAALDGHDRMKGDGRDSESVVELRAALAAFGRDGG